MNKEPYGRPALFRTPVWITTRIDEDAKLKFSLLSYKTIKELSYANYIQSPNLFSIEDILVEHYVDSHGFDSFPNKYVIFMQLPLDEKQYLFGELLRLSSVSPEQRDALKEMLSITLNPKLQGDLWDCDGCKFKKLQAFRACLFIPEEDRQDFKMRLNQKVYTNCPISTLDTFCANQATEAYRLVEAGMLPEDGNVGNQTMWCITAAGIYKNLLQELEKDMMQSR